MSQHGPLCRDMVLRLQGLQGRDRGFTSRDRVVSLSCFPVTIGVLPML